MTRFLMFRPWSVADFDPPWVGTSLYEIVRGTGAEAVLPETRERGDNEFGWAAGALDGVTGRHFNLPEAEQIDVRTRELFAALSKLIQRASLDNLKAFYVLAEGDSILPIADELQKKIGSNLLRQDKFRTRIHDLGRYLMTKSACREGTKLGILLIELTGDEADRDVLETLATHDEFTLYAALALRRLSSDPEEALWEIAKRVHGWGRVQVVERLNRTRNPKIQAWMLREGFRNHILDEYLAGICARTGRLHDALEPVEVDRPLLDGAAGILRALVFGGPADTMDDYPEAPVSIRHYLRHARQTEELELDHLLCIDRLNYFLAEMEGWEDRFSKGWTGDLRDELRVTCQALLKRPEWIGRIRLGLESTDDRVFYPSDAAAQALGINTWKFHFERVRSAPVGSSSWYRLLQQTESDQIDEVLSFAEGALPLKEIASGPSDSLGLGERYAAHQALELVLQELKRFPGRGWRLIEVGLRSPVVRGRNFALNALFEWPRETWPQGAEGVLRRAWEAEPNVKVRERLRQTLMS